MRKTQPEGEPPKPVHVTIVDGMAEALDRYCRENVKNRTDFVRDAVREKLVALGYFTPKKEKET